MTDEGMLTLAKLREQVLGNLDGGDQFLGGAGLADDPSAAQALAFHAQTLERTDRVEADSLAGTRAGSAMLESLETAAANEAVRAGDTSLASYLVGVTEQELDGSSLTVAATLLGELQKPEPTFVLGAGNPEAGKTNTMSLLVEIGNKAAEEPMLVLSNAREWEYCDVPVTNAHDLAVRLLENRGTPMAVFIDEGSTHFDARTKSHVVAEQWSPLAKRFAKLGVELVETIAHTGKDVVPEYKRLVNLAFLKVDQKTAGFYEEWEGDADHPINPLFVDEIKHLEPTSAEYDPDDSAPWNWNLRPELFEQDLDWDEMLDALRRRGPAEE